ncbi:uncharacterized protein LOC133808872 [Humulus lupulus]|uniref:uncharacterized protein LOC133808872 n=1 Tax=Humulus lupulus TaxID=3486 RepID=UPI002B40DB6A|nr:uncharacterized protein LOC133808872 [Humulus lupulus]
MTIKTRAQRKKTNTIPPPTSSPQTTKTPKKASKNTTVPPKTPQISTAPLLLPPPTARNAPTTTSKRPRHKSKRAAPQASTVPPPKQQKIATAATTAAPPHKTKQPATPSHPARKVTSAQAKARFESIKTKKLFPERGFLPTTREVPAFLTTVIEQHQWELFCQKPEYAIIPVVKEFYANLAFAENSEVLVRGKVVSFAGEAINALFGLANVDSSTYNEMILAPTPADFDKALQCVAAPGTQWCISSGGVRTLLHTSILPKAAVWLSFLKCRLLPTTHDTTVSTERVFLLYCILAGLGVNVGQIISRQLASCARKKKGKLFFPSLIT